MYSELGDGERQGLSHRFHSEPAKYLEEKLVAALQVGGCTIDASFYAPFGHQDALMLTVAEELEPAVRAYSERAGGRAGGQGGGRAGGAGGGEEELLGLKSLSLGGRFGGDNLEEDSIFSLGKILMSPRYV